MGKMYGIDEYVSTKRSIATKKASKKAIRHFLEYTTYPDAEITPKTINQVSLDHIINTADHAEILREYCLFLVREHYAPNSINQKIMYVQHWYKWNGIIISPAEAGIIQNIMPRICTVHEDHPLTRQEIQSNLSFHTLTLLCAP